jgi:hypothetical protein
MILEAAQAIGIAVTAFDTARLAALFAAQAYLADARIPNAFEAELPSDWCIGVILGVFCCDVDTQAAIATGCLHRQPIKRC